MKEKFRTLKIYLERIKDNSYEEFDKVFGVFQGITNPGGDFDKKTLVMTYIPGVISKEKILGIVKKIGYKIKKVEDLEN